MFPVNNIMHNRAMSSNTTSTSYTPFVNGGGSDDDGGGHYIEHQVSQFDTLAGVAIKYGVEVADIKRMNGLATDLQMYALKSLQIPSLRRHPPAPSLSNGSPSPGESGTRRTPHRRRHSFAFESFQSGKVKSPHQKVSSAMSTLQNYYGLKSPNPMGLAEGAEMEVYRTGKSDHCDEGLQHKFSLISDSPFNRHHKSNGSLSENGVIKAVPITDVKDGEGDRSNEKSVRRRQKADVDCGGGTPERLLKEENGGGSNSSSIFSAIIGKGLSLRPKSSSRLVAEAESGWLSSTLSALREPLMTDGLARVHKSLSTSSLQDQDNNSSSAWLTSKWNLKPDLQALSAATIARPIFDGLPKPTTGRKNKAALD